MGIVAAAAFVMCSNNHALKRYSLGQLLFGRYMILPIKHIAYCKLVHWWKQTQINYDNVIKKTSILYHNYQMRDKVVLRNKAAYR